MTSPATFLGQHAVRDTLIRAGALTLAILWHLNTERTPRTDDRVLRFAERCEDYIKGYGHDTPPDEGAP